MRAPEEKRPHAIINMQSHYDAAQSDLNFDYASSSLKRLSSDAALFYWHLAQMPEDEPNKEFSRAWICAEWQIINSENIQSLLDHLNEKECLAILQHRELMAAMEKYLPENERASKQAEAMVLA
jgi:membrane glycosyltransferase